MAELPLDPQLSKMVVASPGYKYGRCPCSFSPPSSCQLSARSASSESSSSRSWDAGCVLCSHPARQQPACNLIRPQQQLSYKQPSGSALSSATAGWSLVQLSLQCSKLSPGTAAWHRLWPSWLVQHSRCTFGALAELVAC